MKAKTGWEFIKELTKGKPILGYYWVNSTHVRIFTYSKSKQRKPLIGWFYNCIIESPRMKKKVTEYLETLIMPV